MPSGSWSLVRLVGLIGTLAAQVLSSQALHFVPQQEVQQHSRFGD